MLDAFSVPRVPEKVPASLPLEKGPLGWTADFRLLGHQDGVDVENTGNVPIIYTDTEIGLSIQARQAAYIHCPAFASSFDTEFVISCDGDWYLRGPGSRANHTDYKFSLRSWVGMGQFTFNSNENGTNATRWSYTYPYGANKKPTWVRIVADKYASGWRVAVGIQPEGYDRIWKIYYTSVDAPWVSGNDRLFFYTFFNYMTPDQCPPLKLQYWKVRLR